MSKELFNHTEIIANQRYSFGFAERIRQAVDLVTKHWARITVSGGLFLTTILSPIDSPKPVRAESNQAQTTATLIDGDGDIDVTTVLLMPWNGATPQMISEAAVDLKTIAPFSGFKMNIYSKDPEENLNCNLQAHCDWGVVKRAAEKAGFPVDFPMVVVKNPLDGGHGRVAYPISRSVPPYINPAAVVRVENTGPAELRIVDTGTVAHEHAHQRGLDHEGRDLMERETNDFNAEHTQYLIADNQLLPFSMRRTALNIRPMVNVLQVADQTILDRMELPISAEIPGGTRWVKLYLEQEDGEAVTMVYGSKDIFEKLRKGQFRIENLSKYILQPDQKVRVRIWISNEEQRPAWESPAWQNHKVRPTLTVPASPAEKFYRTPKADSTTISPVNLTNGEQTADLTPTVKWRNSNTDTFYYEVQLSGDPEFNMDPATAKSFVYWNLVHGGITDPANSWTVPDSAKLPPGRYYWRVRPRIQGSGTPVAWSEVYSFNMIPASTAQTLKEIHDLFVDNHVVNPPTVRLQEGSVQVRFNPQEGVFLNREQRRKIARSSKAA